MKMRHTFQKNQKSDGEPAPNYLIYAKWQQIRCPPGTKLKQLLPS